MIDVEQAIKAALNRTRDDTIEAAIEICTALDRAGIDAPGACAIALRQFQSSLNEGRPPS